MIERNKVTLSFETDGQKARELSKPKAKLLDAAELIKKCGQNKALNLIFFANTPAASKLLRKIIDQFPEFKERIAIQESWVK